MAPEIIDDAPYRYGKEKKKHQESKRNEKERRREPSSLSYFLPFSFPYFFLLFLPCVLGLSTSADVYSYAMILFELSARELPWKGKGQTQLFRAVTTGQVR